MAHERTSAPEVDDRLLYPPDHGERFLPRISALEAVRRHWILALLPVVAFVAAAVVLGVRRAPVYTAEARMTVSGIDLSAPGALTGFALASQALATSYSRAVTAEAVVRDVARRTGLRPGEVRAQISASPVPESPVIRVRGRALSVGGAMRLANETAASLRRYVASLDQGRVANSARFYQAYREAATSFQRASLRRADAETAYRESKTKARRDAVIRASAAQSAAALRRDALQHNYLETVAGGAAVADVQPLTVAASATNDRRSRLELYVFVALVAGLLAGITLATLRANALVRRHFTR